MLNTPLIKKCLEIATIAHKGQTRKDGITPYITHPIAVAEMFPNDEELQAVALLHDVIEDSDIKISSLKKEGIPICVLDMVILLTQRMTQNYLDYILQVKQNPDAIKIKLADIKHNSITPSKHQRDKYQLAKYILEN